MIIKYVKTPDCFAGSTGDYTSYDGSGHVTLPGHVTWCQKNGDTSLSTEKRTTDTADFAPIRDTSLHDAAEHHHQNNSMMTNNKFLSVTSNNRTSQKSILTLQSAMFASVDVDYSCRNSLPPPIDSLRIFGGALLNCW